MVIMNKKQNKLGILALTCLSVGPMIGSGLFALPQNLANGSGLKAIMIAWIITLLGMFCLIKVFQRLSIIFTNSNNCLYVYAKEVFGDFFGFSVAWGYWVAGWVGNIAYFLMFCTILNYFFPIFGNTLNLPSLITSSLIVWLLTWLSVKDIKVSALVNTLGTVMKIVPILFFIILCLFWFKKSLFIFNFNYSQIDSSLLIQIKEVMLITAWVFVGIEGASIFSSKAAHKNDINKAIKISFLIMSCIFLLVSLLPFGILKRPEIANLNYPPLGHLTQFLIGPTGGCLINISLMIALLTGALSWVMLSAEVPYLAGKMDNLFPAKFQKINRYGVPVGALIITAICEQIYLIFAYFHHFDYLRTINVAVSMVLPSYLFSALCSLKYQLKDNKDSVIQLFIDLGAILFSLWLIFTAGSYFIFSSLIYLKGIIVYWSHCRKKAKFPFYNFAEKVLLIVIIIASIYTLMCY